MNNCQVKRYKGIVQNDNLEEFETISLLVSSLYFNLSASVANTDKATVIGGTVGGASEYFLPVGLNQTRQLSKNSGVAVAEIKVSPKYDVIECGDIFPKRGISAFASLGLKSFNCTPNRMSADLVAALPVLDLNEFADFDKKNELEVLSVSVADGASVYANLAKMALLTSLTELTLQKVTVSGNLSSLSALKNLTKLFLQSADGSLLSGSIVSLGSMTSLTELTLLNGAANYSGSFEEFVLAQMSATTPRNTGSVSVTLSSSSVRFKGSNISYSASERTLSWAPNAGDNTKTDVTFDGVTVVWDGTNWKYNGEIYEP